jgi:hypothetical protein
MFDSLKLGIISEEHVLPMALFSKANGKTHVVALRLAARYAESCIR